MRGLTLVTASGSLRFFGVRGKGLPPLFRALRKSPAPKSSKVAWRWPSFRPKALKASLVCTAVSDRLTRGSRLPSAWRTAASGGLVDLGLGDSKFRILGQGHFHGLPEFHSLAQRQTRQQPGENQRRQAPQAGGCLTTIMRGHGIDP
jgi:hypothetical protein